MKKVIHIEEILDEYIKGTSIKEIAEKFGIENEENLIFKIHSFINKNHNISIKEKRFLNINGQILDEAKKKGYSLEQLGKAYDLSKIQVIAKINEYYKTKGWPLLENVYEKKDLPVEKITKEYEEDKVSMQSLAKKYGVSYSVIQNRLDTHIRRKDENKLLGFEGEIRKLYECGLPLGYLSKRYHTTTPKIRKLLNNEYEKIGKKFTPTVLTKQRFNTWIRDNTSNNEILSFSWRPGKNQELTIENITKLVESSNVVIPRKILRDFFNIPLNMKNIKLFMENKINHYSLDENQKHSCIKYYDIALFLKDYNLDDKYIATALLYDLPNITKTSIEELIDITDGEIEIVQAIEAINCLDENNYFENLCKNEIAKTVKLGMVLKDFKATLNDKKPINIQEYNKYYNLVENTIFEDDYKALNINKYHEETEIKTKNDLER